MNTPENSTLNFADGSKQLLGVHIAIPAHPVIAQAFPPHNLVATGLIQRLLINALSKADLLLESRVSGEFNNCTLLFVTRSIGPALAVIKSELEEAGILGWAQAATFCRHEEIWRTAFPNPEPTPFEKFVTAEAIATGEAHRLEVQAAVARIVTAGLSR